MIFSTIFNKTVLRSFGLAVAFSFGTFVSSCALNKVAVGGEDEKNLKPIFLSGLGNHTRTISHVNEEGQRWFNQGLNLVYAFNHDEAIRAFSMAAATSPTCVMCFWGIAYAHGPHINNPDVSPENSKAAVEALRHAESVLSNATLVERAMIAALSKRHLDPQPADRSSLDSDYAQAMRELHRQFPLDADVAALTAEALMDLHPWDLYEIDGRPKKWTPEIVEVIEAALVLDAKHPMANHLYIHAMEGSNEPGKAQRSADLLRELQPGLGHMVHMPSHIDVRVGNWNDAIVANQKAIVSDDNYRALSPKQGFYSLYMIHNQQMLSYAAMMSGRSSEALDAIKAMVDGIPKDFRKNAAAIVDPYFALPMEVLMRFGRWDELLATPEYPEDLPASRAFRHAARGIAFAAKHEIESAVAEQKLFDVAALKIPAGALMGQNKVVDLNEVAGHLLAGEILYAQGHTERAFDELRKGVDAEDHLRYDEPPDWMQPVRHALGAALIMSRRFAEAEQLFQADLHRNPLNGWSLFGLSQALDFQGKKEEAEKVHKSFEQVWSKSDLKLHSACLCQPGI